MTADIKSSRKQLSYERILDVAARAVRRHGYAGVGVADVMKEAGLTHGGFYAHFESREKMLAKALEHAGRSSADALCRHMAARRARGESPIRALVESYLSDKHLSSTETGCPVAALGSEMPRHGTDLQDESRRRVEALLSIVKQALPAGLAQENAMVITSTMVGALQLARVLGDNAQGKALLAASRKALLDQYDRVAGPGKH
jgi:AcrR family transcriptional regulator